MKSLFALAVFAIVLAGASQVSYADPVVFFATLNGPSESPPVASLGTGSAIVTFDTALHTMRVQISFSGLTGNTTASHIHAATAVPFAGTAGVATQTPSFSGFPLGVTSGSYDVTFNMTLASSYNASFITANGGTTASAEAALFSFMLQGRSYLNIHSTFAPGGEIRGFLQTPEPATMLLLGTGLAGIAAKISRRRRAGKSKEA